MQSYPASGVSVILLSVYCTIRVISANIKASRKQPIQMRTAIIRQIISALVIDAKVFKSLFCFCLTVSVLYEDHCHKACSGKNRTVGEQQNISCIGVYAAEKLISVLKDDT